MDGDLALVAPECAWPPLDATKWRVARPLITLGLGAVFSAISAGCDPPQPRPETDEVSQVQSAPQPTPRVRVDPSNVKDDEQVLFVPTFATREGEVWELPIEAWVFEPEADSRVRSKVLDSAREVLELREDTDVARVVQVMRWFMVDNERGKSVPMELGGIAAQTGVTGADGRSSGVLRVPVAAVADLGTGKPPFVRPRLVLAEGDPREFTATVQLLPDSGVSVVSDIDDTIKVSDVTNKAALLENTFARPYTATPGMVKAYQRWATQGVAFHYISNSPLPLLVPLEEFFEESGLPPGSLGLKPFRWTDGSFAKLFAAPALHKQKSVEQTIRAFEKREFVLVGDSGELDPEIYAAVARSVPGRVRHVYIRDVRADGTPAIETRMKLAFEGLPAGLWTLVRSGDALPERP